MAVSLLIKPALEGMPVAYMAPTYKMLEEFWREMRITAAPVAARVSEQSKRIELVTGGVIDMWSLDAFESIRGRKYARVVPDEAAMVPNLGEAWQAVIRPTLTDLRGDMYMLSTPRGMNFFWQCYQRGLDTQQPDWAHWQMPTSTNPYIDPDEIEAARQELPERVFAQEYLAQFLDDAGGVFRNVVACSTGYPQEPQPGRQYVIGADWGKSYDFSVFSVWDVQAKQEVLIDRSNKVDYEVQINRLVPLAQRYNNALVIPELNSIGTPIVERLERLRVRVQPFTMTNATKKEIVEGMQLDLENHKVTLLHDSVATAEMQAYEMERLPSGLWRYSAPEGQHDDTVIARCLARYGATNSGGFSRPYDQRTRVRR
jgi:phage FluMu gp28-like protein